MNIVVQLGRYYLSQYKYKRMLYSLFGFYNKYISIPLLKTFISILIIFSDMKSTRYDVFVNNSLNLLKTLSQSSDYLYEILFLISSINNNIIREQFFMNRLSKFLNLKNSYIFLDSLIVASPIFSQFWLNLFLYFFCNKESQKCDFFWKIYISLICILISF